MKNRAIIPIIEFRDAINTTDVDVELRDAVVRAGLGIGDITSLQAELDAKELTIGVPANDNQLKVYHADGSMVYQDFPNSAEWGNIVGDITTQTDLMDEFAKKADINHNHDTEYYRQDQFIDISSGTNDAGKPIILNSRGVVDASMIDVSSMYPVGEFTPQSGAEYPDTTGEVHGAYWVVTGVDSDAGYTFTEGDLTGQTAYNGSFMIWGSDAWILHVGVEVDPVDYYRRDGTQPITADLQGGGFRAVNFTDAIDDTDLPTFGQVKALPPIGHDHTEMDIVDLDKYTQAEVDALLDTKEDSLGVGQPEQALFTATDGAHKTWRYAPWLEYYDDAASQGSLTNGLYVHISDGAVDLNDIFDTFKTGVYPYLVGAGNPNATPLGRWGYLHQYSYSELDSKSQILYPYYARSINPSDEDAYAMGIWIRTRYNNDISPWYNTVMSEGSLCAIRVVTQSEYDASIKNENTLYVIVG